MNNPSKQQLRKSIQEKLLAYPHWQYDDAIVANLFSIFDGLDNLVIGLYYPLLGEVNILGLIANLKAKFALPQLIGNRIEYKEIRQNQKLVLTNSTLPSFEGKIIEPDVIMVPGLAFDYSKYRLGRGGGHFDRYIAHRRGESPEHINSSHKDYMLSVKMIRDITKDLQSKKCPLFLGICYLTQMLDQLELEPHDQKVDFIITEKRII